MFDDGYFSGCGYISGLAGCRRSFAALIYSVVFAAVTVMIAIADAPGSDQIKMSHRALSDLQVRLNGHRDGGL